MNHSYEHEQRRVEEIEDAGRVEDILEHADDLQKVERKLEGVENPRKMREILENIPDIYHVEEHHGLHEGFRRAMYHMDEYQDLHERRLSNAQKRDRSY